MTKEITNEDIIKNYRNVNAEQDNKIRMLEKEVKELEKFLKELEDEYYDDNRNRIEVIEMHFNGEDAT